MIRNKNTNTYYNYDAHGDVVQLTDANGTVKADYTYDAFGNQKTSTNIANPFRYCGEYYDNESGLIYLRNRYYNPSTGRFINEDPIRSGGNWYSYCDNNPVLYYDYNGLDKETIGNNKLDIEPHSQLGDNSCAAANIAEGIAMVKNENNKLVNNESINDVVTAEEVEREIWEIAESNKLSVNENSTINRINSIIGYDPDTNLYNGFNTPIYDKDKNYKKGTELSAKVIMNHIDAGSDIKVLYNKGSGADYLGHYITIIGYNYTEDVKQVIYNDTADGKTHVVTLSDIQTYVLDPTKDDPIVGGIDSIYVQQKPKENVEKDIYDN